MKRLRLVVTAGLLAALCLGLCSCNYLDNIRANRADIVSDEEIFYNGHTYKPLSLGAHVEQLGYAGNRWVNVVDAEVPLLLTDMYGRSGICSADEKIMRVRGIFYGSDELTEAEIASLRSQTFTRYVIPFYSNKQGFSSPEVTAALDAVRAQEPFVGEHQTDYYLDRIVGEWFYPTDDFGYFLGTNLGLFMSQTDELFLYEEATQALYKVPAEYGELLMQYAESMYTCFEDECTAEMVTVFTTEHNSADLVLAGTLRL